MSLPLLLINFMSLLNKSANLFQTNLNSSAYFYENINATWRLGVFFVSEGRSVWFQSSESLTTLIDVAAVVSAQAAFKEFLTESSQSFPVIERV